MCTNFYIGRLIFLHSTRKPITFTFSNFHPKLKFTVEAEKSNTINFAHIIFPKYNNQQPQEDKQDNTNIKQH